MKKLESPKRLNLRRETLLALTQLSHVVGGGGGTIISPTQPHLSCVVVCGGSVAPCVPSVPCVTLLCEVETARC